MIIGDLIIKRKLAKLIRQNRERDVCYCSLDSANEVVLLFHQQDREHIDACRDKLVAEGKKVSVVLFIPGKPDTIGSIPDYVTVLSKESLSVFDIPHKKVCDDFRKLKADILIDLTGPKCYTMKYLALIHPSSFKVGVQRTVTDAYDFSLAVTDNDQIPYLFDQILFYLKTIRSK